MLHAKIIKLLTFLNYVNPTCKGVCNGIKVAGVRAFLTDQLDIYQTQLLKINHADTAEELRELLKDESLVILLRQIIKAQNGHTATSVFNHKIDFMDLPELLELESKPASSTQNALFKINFSVDFGYAKDKINYATAIPNIIQNIDYAIKLAKETKAKLIIDLYVARMAGPPAGHTVFLQIDPSGSVTLWDANYLLIKTTDYVNDIFDSLVELAEATGPGGILTAKTYIYWDQCNLENLTNIQKQIIINSFCELYNTQFNFKKIKSDVTLKDWLIAKITEGASLATINSTLLKLFKVANPYLYPIDVILPTLDHVCYLLYQLTPKYWPTILAHFAMRIRVDERSHGYVEESIDVESLLLKFPPQQWLLLLNGLGYLPDLEDMDAKLQSFYHRLPTLERNYLISAIKPDFLYLLNLEKKITYLPQQIAAPLIHYAEAFGLFKHHRKRALYIAERLQDQTLNDDERKAIIQNQKDLLAGNPIPPNNLTVTRLGLWAIKLMHRPTDVNHSGYYQALCESENKLSYSS